MILRDDNVYNDNTGTRQKVYNVWSDFPISPIGLLHICTCSAHQTSILPNILLFTSLIIYGPRNNDKNVHWRFYDFQKFSWPSLLEKK